MSDEVIGYANGLPVYEQRTAHGADGKFTSGAGGGVHAGKAAKHEAEAHKLRDKRSRWQSEEGAKAHEASAKAWKTGSKADHAAAAEAHNKMSAYPGHAAHAVEHAKHAASPHASAAASSAKHYQSKADKETHPERKKAFQASADAYKASEKAHTSGAAHDHAAAHTAHEHAQKLHSAIHGSSEHSGSVKGAHGREAAGHGLALKDHKAASGPSSENAGHAAKWAAKAHEQSKTATTHHDYGNLSSSHQNAHDFHQAASKEKGLSQEQREHHKAQAQFHKDASAKAEAKFHELHKAAEKHKVGGYIPSATQYGIKVK